MLLQDAAETDRQNPGDRGGEEASHSPGARTHSAKRPRKIALRACDACSKRKIRCDQASPKCAPCETSGLRCAYTRPKNRRGRPSTITREFMEESQANQPEHADVQDAHFDFTAEVITANSESTSISTASNTSSNFMRLEQILAMPMAVPVDNQHDHHHLGTPSDSDHAPASVLTSAPRPICTTVSDPFGGAAGAPPTGLDTFLPWQAVCQLIELFFSHLWPRLPIIHQPSFRQDMQDRRDRDSASWYMLVLNVCAATAIACKPLPMPGVLSQLGYEWEGLARHLNSCLRQMGAWIHTMAHASSLVCLQNILLVAYFERCIGSPIADRLGSEGQRIAQAFHFNMEIPGLDAVEAELRRRIFWSLYTQDKFDAILHRRAMAMRQDEVMVELPSIQLSEHIMDTTVDTSELLRPFLCRIQICQTAETILLRWRGDARYSITPENIPHIRSHLHQSLEQIIACSTRTQIEQNDIGVITNEISTLILETCLTVDVYHRYFNLLVNDRSALGQRLCSVAAKVSSEVSRVPTLALQMLEPTLFAMFELVYKRIQMITTYISDPLARRDASEVELAMESLVLAGRPNYPCPGDVGVNTASMTASSRSQVTEGVFENVGLPSENVLPGDVPGIPTIFGQSGLGTLDFLNDLSTTSLQNVDWFAFFEA